MSCLEEIQLLREGYDLVLWTKHGKDLLEGIVYNEEKSFIFRMFIVVLCVSLKKYQEQKYSTIKIATFVFY